MNFATAVLSGTICSPVQHLENGQVRFSLQNEEGIFLIKVLGLAQVRMYISLAICIASAARNARSTTSTLKRSSSLPGRALAEDCQRR
jgi:hypothetical protein